MTEFLKNLPASLFSGLIVAIVVVVLFVPIALRVAGLSGQQIMDVLVITFRAFIDLVRDFREKNKSP